MHFIRKTYIIYIKLRKEGIHIIDMEEKYDKKEEIYL